jgi:hypothetical protein
VVRQLRGLSNGLRDRPDLLGNDPDGHLERLRIDARGVVFNRGVEDAIAVDEHHESMFEHERMHVDRSADEGLGVFFPVAARDGLVLLFPQSVSRSLALRYRDS